MPAIIEREKVSPMMQQALRGHIVREREKRKQEAAEAEKVSEQKAREEEEIRKKIEEENSTLEEIKEQLDKLKDKLSGLREEKHHLFWQFKALLHEESKRKARQREQNEIAGVSSPFSQHGMRVSGHAMGQAPRLQGHGQHTYMSQPSRTMPGNPSMQQGVKRPHSPNAQGIHMYARPTLMYSSPQHKHDSNYAAHGSYLSPAHGSNHHSVVTTTPGRAYSSYSTPDRGGSAHHGKPEPGFLEDQSRNRIRMMPQSLSQQATSQFPHNSHSRSNSPGRFQVKSEKEMMSFSPGSSGSPAHHKYSSPQSNSRLMYMKHP
uniref:G protein pathway suppressor 2 n=1 Tax=Phallusia mammillata TaxID=59560 RepID=A0A6F9DEI7_9ASCI|nr:G protein pathway suppressor 2 [Phallusia mammillata]